MKNEILSHFGNGFQANQIPVKHSEKKGKQSEICEIGVSVRVATPPNSIFSHLLTC